MGTTREVGRSLMNCETEFLTMTHLKKHHRPVEILIPSTLEQPSTAQVPG